MPVTQKDIADHLGISRQIVGYALNGNAYVADETRRRVLEAASELGYSMHSNQAARSLIAQRYGSKARKDAFAVLMPPFDGNSIRKAPYYTPILDGIESEASARELGLFLHSIRYEHRPHDIGDFLVDGVIGFISTVERNEWMHRHGMPLVTIDGCYEDVSTIHADHIAGISLCTQHLIGLGHRRIAYFSMGFEADYRFGVERFDSFCETMTRGGLTIDPNLIWQDCVRMQRGSAAEAMARMLSRDLNFTAVVCWNDTLAMGAIDALTLAGRRIPDDVSVTGFDDISGGYVFSPEITSIAFDREEMGRQSVRMLYTMVNAAIAEPLATVPVTETILPVELAVHGSTGPATQ